MRQTGGTADKAIGRDSRGGSRAKHRVREHVDSKTRASLQDCYEVYQGPVAVADHEERREPS
jgi:hypothetical protein